MMCECNVYAIMHQWDMEAEGLFTYLCCWQKTEENLSISHISIKWGVSYVLGEAMSCHRFHITQCKFQEYNYDLIFLK